MKHTHHKMYRKMAVRSVRGSIARFLSILAIVLVGSGFLAGLLATKPDMQRTADRYADDCHLYDIQVRSTWGLDSADVAALEGLPGVERVMACVSKDLILETSDGSAVTRLYGVDLTRPDSLINGFRLKEGRMPVSKGECLLAVPNTYAGSHSLGEVFTLSEDNRDYETLGETVAFDSLTVVGLVDTPQYMSIESEPSTAGSGSVRLIMYVFPECFSMDVATDAFLTVKGAAARNAFSDAYGDLLDEQTEAVKTLAETRTQSRFDEKKNEASRALADAKADFEARSTETGRQLAAAESELLQAAHELSAERAALRDVQAWMTPAQLQAAEAKLEEASAALEKRQTALNDALEEADAQRQTAEASFAASQEALDALEKPEWILSDRRSNVSYRSYKSNSEKMAAIAKVFPVFFFLVAALVALTTMTRMVEEERTQIGMLKAIGYSKSRILAYYLGYSIFASLAGSAAGTVLGFYTLPPVIANAYGMMYTLPKTVMDFYWGYAGLIVLISVGCTTAATAAACLTQLSEKPAALMLPKAPKSGKRILLEHIQFIWRRMGFIAKVTARNIFRYKKRLLMTVFGIAGCTALLVTAFGLRDSIHEIVDRQFGELYQYNLTLYLTDDGVTETNAALHACMTDPSRITSYALFHSESVQLSANGEQQRVTLYAPQETASLKENIVLRDRKTHDDIPFGEDSVILTEKLGEQLNLSVGDAVTVENADGRKASFAVTAFAENYVTGAIFLPAERYAKAFGTAPSYRLALAKTADESEAARNALASDLLDSGGVLMTQFSETIRESFENTVKSIDYIVVVLILAAGALAMIVLYNLTNINICEREKELATIKVLGFHENEVAAYIYRETSVLALLGILAGFAFGVWLHAFVVRTAEVDAVMFGRTLSGRSLLYAAIVTVVFTALVDLIMLPKLKKIDMAKSMKANE